MKESTIGDYYEDKRLEAERLRREISECEQLVKESEGLPHALPLMRRITVLKQKLELALYVGD